MRYTRAMASMDDYLHRRLAGPLIRDLATPTAMARSNPASSDYVGWVQLVPRYAKLRTPAWLWGGDPRALLISARLRSRPAGDGVWSVQTEESYMRRPPDLFRHAVIAGPDVSGDRFDDLAR